MFSDKFIPEIIKKTFSKKEGTGIGQDSGDYANKITALENRIKYYDASLTEVINKMKMLKMDGKDATKLQNLADSWLNKLDVERGELKKLQALQKSKKNLSATDGKFNTAEKSEDSPIVKPKNRRKAGWLAPVRAAVLGTALFSSANIAGSTETKIGEPEVQSIINNRAKESEARNATPEVEPTEKAVADRTVLIDGQEFSAEDIDALLLQEMKTELGQLAEKCLSAEQCYYYYGNQLRLNSSSKAYSELTNVVAKVTGHTKEELSFISEVVRGGGIVKQSGLKFPGAYVGVVEVAAEELPPISKTSKASFHERAYKNSLDEINLFLGALNLNVRSTTEKEQLANLIIKVETANNRLAATTIRLTWRAENDSNFNEWFLKGIGSSSQKSGEEILNSARQEQIQAYENLNDYVKTLPDLNEEAVKKISKQAKIFENRFQVDRATILEKALQKSPDGFLESDATRLLREKYEASKADTKTS